MDGIGYLKQKTKNYNHKNLGRDCKSTEHNLLTIKNNPYSFLNGGVNVKIVFMWKFNFIHDYNCQWFQYFIKNL